MCNQEPVEISRGSDPLELELQLCWESFLGPGTAEIAQQLSEVAALAEDKALILSALTVAHNCP